MLVLRKLIFINLKSYLKYYSLKYIYEIVSFLEFCNCHFNMVLKKSEIVHTMCNVNFPDGKDMHYYY